MKTLRTIAIGLMLAAATALWLFTETAIFYPGGAINFMGMDKQQVIRELDSVRVPYGGYSTPSIYLTVRSTGKYYQTIGQAIADPFTMTEGIWYVNP